MTSPGPSRARERIKNWFPKLSNSDFELNSSKDRRYNCIAFAAEDTERWWQPLPFSFLKKTPFEMERYWPDEAPNNKTPEAYIIAFECLGYEKCKNSRHEKGYKKVAIYTNNKGQVEHMARQIKTGKWVSKLGKAEDIIHENLTDIEGEVYGNVEQIMKKDISK